MENLCFVTSSGVTTILQLMEQRVIQNMKCHYRKCFLYNFYTKAHENADINEVLHELMDKDLIVLS